MTATKTDRPEPRKRIVVAEDDQLDPAAVQAPVKPRKSRKESTQQFSTRMAEDVTERIEEVATHLGITQRKVVETLVRGYMDALVRDYRE